MISTETITEKFRMLPTSSQERVLELIDEMLRQSGKMDSTDNAAAWIAWTESHRETTVISDDSRATIYGDE